MNSADVHKSMKGDSGMEDGKHYMALGCKGLTSGERKAWSSHHVSGGDSEVQDRLDFTKKLHGEKGLMEQRRIPPSLDRWEVMG